MAPKVAKKNVEEKARSRSPKRAEPTKDEPKKEEAKEEEEKFMEQDAPKDSRPALKDKIRIETPDTTLNVVPTLGGRLLTSLTEGGMSAFLAGARANVAQKAGRYMFEAKIVEGFQSQ